MVSIRNKKCIDILKVSDLSQYDNLSDLFDLAVSVMEEDPKELEYVLKITGYLKKHLIRNMDSQDDRIIDLYYRLLKFEGPYVFDSYLLYVEKNREPEKKFYLPRRNVLKVLVDDLQDLADGKIDFLGISLPPRVGKSTLCIFFMTWLMGRKPEIANLMSGHSDKLTDGFYGEILSILNDNETYLWHDVFSSCKVVSTSSKNETIDLNRKKRFPTMTCRSIGGTLTGAVEIGTGGCLYCDDLIEDLEEALNMDRLDKKYDAYLNQLKDRKKVGAFELMVGTRWSVFDPLGRIQAQYEGNERYRFRVISALNENDETNFLYDYDLGFTTEYYHDMRQSIDDATWWAKYMGQPYVREGLLFPQDELLWYNGVLPGEDTDSRLSATDVAFGGGDSVSAPIAYIFGDSVYIHDVVFNNKGKDVTEPLVAGAYIRNKVQIGRFEANNGGDAYANEVDQLMRNQGYKMNIQSVKAPNQTSKMTRILQYQPEIKKFYFRKDLGRGQEYDKFIKELTITVVDPKGNKHDDAADSLRMLAEMVSGGLYAKCKPMRRPC